MYIIYYSTHTNIYIHMIHTHKHKHTHTLHISYACLSHQPSFTIQKLQLDDPRIPKKSATSRYRAAPHPFRSWWHSRNALWPARSRAPCDPTYPIRDRSVQTKIQVFLESSDQAFSKVSRSSSTQSWNKAWKGIVCVCNTSTFEPGNT